MDTNTVKSILEKEYGLKANEIAALKNIYRISCSDEEFCLKVIKYEFGHFFFIISAMKHLQEKGFCNVPEFIKTKDGCDYIKLGDNYAYLTKWVNARHCNYDNPIDIDLATRKLAELHIKSSGFNLTSEMKPRVGWLKWIETYKTRKNEILDFKQRILKKDNPTKFDELYLEIMDDELNRADRAINNLINSNYIEKMKKEMEYKTFCHHDYAYHNVLIDNKNQVTIIDFDYCILDTHLHDLSSLLIRRMKYGKWDMKNVNEILKIYNSIKEIKEDDIPIMASFMEFPQDYWQRGIQYYWEEKPWGEEFFLKKLQKYMEDREQKQELIELLRKSSL